MANKKTTKEKRKILKKYGFINQDLRKNPTPQQKSAITRQWTRYGRYFDSGFVRRKITKTQRRKFQTAGYLVKGNNVFINRERYNRVYVAKNHILKTLGDKKQRVLLHDPKELIDQMEKTLKKGLKPGQYLSVKIGDHSVFGWRTMDMDEFLQYITHVFKANMTTDEKRRYKTGNKKEQTKIDKAVEQRTQKLITQMSIVTIDQKRKDNPSRAKKRGTTKK